MFQWRFAQIGIHAPMWLDPRIFAGHCYSIFVENKPAKGKGSREEFDRELDSLDRGSKDHPGRRKIKKRSGQPRSLVKLRAEDFQRGRRQPRA